MPPSMIEITRIERRDQPVDHAIHWRARFDHHHNFAGAIFQRGDKSARLSHPINFFPGVRRQKMPASSVPMRLCTATRVTVAFHVQN